MITDPSWLYSTIAQSSAAIVAIVGGFITASVLMLLAEKRSLSHQQADMETRLGALKVEERQASEVYETMKVNKFFNAVADDLKKEEKLPPLQVLMQRYPGWNLDHGILKQEYEKLSKSRLEARQFIEQHSDKIGLDKFVLFDDWVRENDLDISSYDYELLEEEYYTHRNREEEILEEEKRKAIPPQLRGMFERFTVPTINLIPTSPQLTQLKTQYELYQRQKEDRRLEDVEGRLSSLRHEIFVLEGEVANLDARIRTFSYPPYLRLAAYILLFFAIFSIALPISLILNEVFTPVVKQFTFAIFMAGLIAVIVYIALLIRELRGK
jgi:hypothetical protein